VADFPPGFVADLRRLRRWPDLADSLWRSPVLVELTHGRLWRLVAEALPPPPARVLDIGSGTGVVSLAMAQAGHDVTAIDPDPTAIELAERSAHRARAGRLVYHRSDVATWVADQACFDVIVTSRTLHHVSDPAEALQRIHGWLRPGGRLVCVDFLHDRFDGRDARWVAQVRGLLEAVGACCPDGRLPTDPAAAVERIEWEWDRDHVIDHDLNRSADILVPLSRLFPTGAESWHPYLYWDILEALDVPDPAAEESIATLVANWEASLLVAGELSPLLVRFVGQTEPG
jgi:SAM-dependent methyltransferase